MTNSESEASDAGTQGIDDDQLPEDLRPSEDNPLAVSLDERDDARDPEELDMQGGNTPVESGSDDEPDEDRRHDQGDQGGAGDSAP